MSRIYYVRLYGPILWDHQNIKNEIYNSEIITLNWKEINFKLCLGNYRRSISLTKYYCVLYSTGCSEVIVNRTCLCTYLIRFSIRGLGVSIGHCCLDLNFSGNMRRGGLRNCIDCKDFSWWMFAKVFLTVNLFSITTAQVSLMCQRFVDFHEPIYHRLLNGNNNTYILGPMFG